MSKRRSVMPVRAAEPEPIPEEPVNDDDDMDNPKMWEDEEVNYKQITEMKPKLHNAFSFSGWHLGW